MTIAGPDGNKVVDNIVGTGNNMHGEIAVNATACEPNPVSCPAGLTIKMQYKSQFHPDIVRQGIPNTIEFVRKDIYYPLTSITDIEGEFEKLGAKIEPDADKQDEYVVKFTLKSPDLPMPKGYNMQVTLKKIADDKLVSSTINIDDTRYFSTTGGEEAVKVTGITVNNKNIGLEVGKTAKLNWTITPLDADNKNVKFATYNDNVATISLDGTITAVSVGETEVEVTTVDGAFTDKAKVVVVDKLVKVEDIEAGADTVTLDINLDPSKAQKTADVKFNVTPLIATNKQILLKDGYDKNLIDAKISNGADGIATLSISGKFSTGTTKLVVYADDNPSIEKTVQVTVKDTTIHPTSVSISEENKTMIVGDTAQLKATVIPEDAYIKTVKWSSNNISAVQVDENTGKLTAVGAGSAIITATTVDGNHVAECNVTVENKYVQVQSVSFSSESTTFAASATGISVTANVSPNDATDKGITYSSSDSEKVAVDANTGVLTIKDTSATEDYQVTITAKSNEDENISDTIIVHIKTIFVDVTNVTITNKLGSPSELKLGDTYNVEYLVEPSNATNQNVNISADSDVLSYNAATNTFQANKAGTATIKVVSQSNPDKQDSFQVTVWEPADITGKYSVESLEIHYQNKVVKSSEAATDGYLYDQKEIAVSTENNQLDISGKMQLVWSQFIQNPEFDVFRYKYFTHNENLSDRENSKDKLQEKGFTFNNDGTLNYEFPFVLGANNTLEYSAGSQDKLVFKLKNKTAYTKVIDGKYRYLTPVNFADPYTIMGTYDILTFEQTNNMGYNVGAKHYYEEGFIFNKKKVNSLDRMIGEITAVVNTKDKTIDMNSKLQMDSKMLNSNPVDQKTNIEQYQNTLYQPMTYSLDSIANGFGNGTSKDSGTVTFNNEIWEGQKSDIKIYSTFYQLIATVEVNVFGKKKLDEVITLDANMPYYCNDYFYLPDNVKANCPISNEPPADKGKVTQLWK